MRPITKLGDGDPLKKLGPDEPKPKAKKAAQHDAEPDDFTRAHDLARAKWIVENNIVHPDAARAKWLQHIMALASLGPEGEQLAREHSSKGDKFDESKDCTDEQFAGFRGDVSIASFFKAAFEADPKWQDRFDEAQPKWRDAIAAKEFDKAKTKGDEAKNDEAKNDDDDDGDTTKREKADPFAGRWLRPTLEWMTTEPPRQRFLVRHPSPFDNGAGLLPRGVGGLLGGEGGIGKTVAQLDLGVAVITGGAWFGYFPVDDAAGDVCALCAEEDEAEMRRRLHRATRHLTPEQQEMVTARLVIVPMHGRDVAMLARASNRDAAVATPFFDALRERLVREAGPDGWAALLFGPLSRLGGVPLDADNANGTAIIQAFETLTEVPGNPTVLVDCHTNADSRKHGKASVRGPTALVDGVRWWASLHRPKEGGPVVFTPQKTNRGPLDGRAFVLDKDADGLLRVRDSGPTAEVDRAEREKAEQAAAVAAMEQQAVDALTGLGGRCRGAEPIYARMIGKTDAKRAGLKGCLGRTIAEEGASKRPEYVLIAQEGVARTPPTPPTPRGEGRARPARVAPTHRKARRGEKGRGANKNGGEA